MWYQALHTEDGSLPQGLTVQNAYTELWKGSKNIVMVVRNKYGISADPEEEDFSGKGSSGNKGARATYKDWSDGRDGQVSMPLNT